MARRREAKPRPESTPKAPTLHPAQPAALPLVLFLASGLFVASGATGLAYEVIWFKRFTHVWGSSSTAIAAVVASFLFGLGVGAYLLGKVADRVATPLKWYGICELGIGLFALVAQLEIDVLARATAAIESVLPPLPGLAFGLRFLITLLIIGPPCILMGGTLPLLVRQFTPARSALSAATGWLYAVNTLGAGAGSYLTGFHLLPVLGLPATNRVAAITNLAIGLVSITLAGRLAPARTARGPLAADSAPAATSPEGVALRLAWSRVHVAAALTGAAALILQITWNRQLAVVLGGSTYAFTATLFVVLIAIAAGSLIFHAVFRRHPFRARAAFADAATPDASGRGRRVAAAIALAIAATAVASRWAIPWLSDQVGSIAHLRAAAGWNAAISVGASAAVELLPSLGMGFLFPLLVALTRGTGAEAGRAIGGLYVWNTAGSLAGATLTAILVFPLGGTALATAIAVALYVVTALLLGTRARAAVVGVALGVVLVFLALYPIDPRATDMGAYLYGPLTREARAHTRVHFFQEGASCNVLVTDEGTSRNLRVNGKIDATTGNDMATQLGLAYLPRAFHPGAREVAIIGYGSGTTAGATLLFPETRVVCSEIEPAVYATSSLFSSANHGVETHPGLTMFFGDGRSYLQGTRDTFDLIISEPSNPWLAGVSNLFTEEFFATVKERLRPGGVLAQWIQTYGFSIAEHALIVRTLRTVFPHYGLISLAEGQDTILLASTAPLAPDSTSMAELAAVITDSPAIRRDLTAHFGTDDMRQILLTSHVLDEQGLDRLIAADRAATLNTDANVRLEFDAPLHLFETSELARTEIAHRIIAAADRAWIAARAEALGLAPGAPARALALGRLDRRQGRLPAAIAELSAATGAEPPLAAVYRELAGAHLAAGDTAASLRVHTEWTARFPEDPEAHATLGGLLILMGRTRDAVPSFAAAIALDPDLASSANNLAWIRATHRDPAVRDGAEAVRLAQRACELTGFQQPDCLDTLAAAYAEKGDFAAAERLARQALATGVTGRVAHAEIEQRLALYARHEPFRDR